MLKAKMDNLIIWQKWFDPFGGDEEINIEAKHISEQQEEDDEKFIDDEEYLDNDGNHHLNSKPVRAIATPMGLIPYTENTASGKIFNFWIGHTNFSITKKIADIIESSEGVETLDVFTRYRFRIAIGKVFDSSKVMKQINDQVYEYLG